MELLNQIVAYLQAVAVQTGASIQELVKVIFQVKP